MRNGTSYTFLLNSWLLKSGWTKILVIIVDLWLVKVNRNVLIFLILTLRKVREQRLLTGHEPLLRYLHVLFARRSFLHNLFGLLDSSWLGSILTPWENVRLDVVLARHWSLLHIWILLANRLSLFHNLRVWHRLVNELVPLQVLSDQFAQVEHWLFSDLALKLADCIFSFGQIESLAIFLREEIAHIVAVVSYKLVFYCFLHVIDLRFLQLDWCGTKVSDALLHIIWLYGVALVQVSGTG